jgi:hypothetical protein
MPTIARCGGRSWLTAKGDIMTTNHTRTLNPKEFTAEAKRRISKELAAWRALRPVERGRLSEEARDYIAGQLQLDTLGLPQFRSPRCGKRGRDLAEQLAELETLGRKFAAEGRIEAAITELRDLIGRPARVKAIGKRLDAKAKRRAGGR